MGFWREDAQLWVCGERPHSYEFLARGRTAMDLWREAAQKRFLYLVLFSIALRSPHLRRLMTKPTKWHMRPANTQISRGIRPVWSESSLSTWRKFGSLASHWAHSEDSDQTGRMPRLIWVFAGRTVILLVLSWGGSFWNEAAYCLLVSPLFVPEEGCDLWLQHSLEIFSLFSQTKWRIEKKCTLPRKMVL